MESACFATGSAELRFVSPVADGADQIAAEVALELGGSFRPCFPSSARTTARPSPTRRAGALRRVARRAACVLELPGDPADVVDAYVMTGRATVAHCDILIAVWDGLPPRGRGGTGEVVQLAMTRGTAVVHLPLEPDARHPVAVERVRPDGGHCHRRADRRAPARREDVDMMLKGLLMPPARRAGAGFPRPLLPRTAAPDPGADRISFAADGRRRSTLSGARLHEPHAEHR